MQIKPIQAKIIGGIVLVAGIAMIIANINGLKTSTQKDNVKTPAEKAIPATTSEPTAEVEITLSPTSGPVGTSIILAADKDNTFTPTGNSVNFNGSKNTIINLDSSDGKTLRFNIPKDTSSLDGADADEYSHFPVLSGVYSISVTNSSGLTSTTQSFTITDSDSTSPDNSKVNNKNTNTAPPAHIDSTENSGQNSKN